MNFYSSNFVGWDILNGSPCMCVCTVFRQVPYVIRSTVTSLCCSLHPSGSTFYILTLNMDPLIMVVHIYSSQSELYLPISGIRHVPRAVLTRMRNGCCPKCLTFFKEHAEKSSKYSENFAYDFQVPYFSYNQSLPFLPVCRTWLVLFHFFAN